MKITNGLLGKVTNEINALTKKLVIWNKKNWYNSQMVKHINM